MGVIDVGALLTQRLALLAPSRVQSGSGGFSTTYAVAEYVRGRLTTPTRNKMYERIRGEQAGAGELVAFTARQGTARIVSNMRLRAPDGTEYEVVELERQDGYVFGMARAVD